MAPSRNRRPGFSRRAQYGLFLGYVIAVAGALIGAALLALATFHPQALAALRMTMSEGTTPLSSAMSVVTRAIAAVPENVSNYITAGSQNADLKDKLKRDDALLMRARSLSYENRRLRALLKVRDGVALPVVSARLVSSSASSTRRLAVLNAGWRQGVAEGQPVRGPEGLIGRILEVGPNTAHVLLLSDPESIVPVRRTRDGMPAIAAGRGDGWVEIRAVSGANAPFEPGDAFITSGAGGIFPPNVPVARVAQKSRDTALGHIFAQADTLDFALVQRAFLPPPPAPAAPAAPPPKQAARDDAQ